MSGSRSVGSQAQVTYHEVGARLPFLVRFSRMVKYCLVTENNVHRDVI